MARKKVAPEEKIVNAVGEETALGSVPADTAPPDETGADMTQREIRYAAIPDLRTEFHPGSEIDCIVKEYHPRTGELSVSAKETEVNPFFGAEERHPVGSRRFAMISGKYGGGVFCNLPDGVTCMCNYSYQHEDADFMVGEHVMLMVQRYDQEKLQMYGKIMSKW